MGVFEHRILVKERIDRREFLLFLQDFPGMIVSGKALHDAFPRDDDEYRHTTWITGKYYEPRDAWVTEPYVSAEEAPYIQLRLIPEDEFEQMKSDGELYEDPIGTAEENASDAMLAPQFFGGEPQSLVIMYRFSGARGPNGDLLTQEILRAIGGRWGGAYDGTYYNGEETEALPPRPTVPLPPPLAIPHPPNRELGGRCEHIVFSSVYIRHAEFRDFLRGFPGMYVPKGGSDPIYDGYWEAPNVNPRLAKYPVWMYAMLHDWTSVRDDKPIDPIWKFKHFGPLRNEDGVPDRVIEALGWQPRSLIEIHYGFEDDMLGHQLACAAMRRWPGVYDTATIGGDYETFTLEEVAEAVRRGVHPYFVTHRSARLPPETHEEIVVVPKSAEAAAPPPIIPGAKGPESGDVSQPTAKKRPNSPFHRIRNLIAQPSSKT